MSFKLKLPAPYGFFAFQHTVQGGIRKTYYCDFVISVEN